jgi:hypothetical protein
MALFSFLDYTLKQEPPRIGNLRGMSAHFSNLLAGVLVLTSIGLPAAGQTLTLFGRNYLVQTFDYTSEITFPNPMPNGPATVGWNESEGAQWIGNNRFVLCSNEMGDVGSYKNQVIEAALQVSPAGIVTGFSYVRHLHINDNAPVASGGLGDPFSTKPRGVTVNVGTSGLGAGGNVIIADAVAEYAREISFVNGGLTGNLFSVFPPNDDFEDLVFAQDAQGGGLFYTVRQKSPHSVNVFTANGSLVNTWFVGPNGTPAQTGEPKGIAWLPESAALPDSLQGLGGVILVALDDLGPALAAYRMDGTAISIESIVHPLLNPGNQISLQIEAVTFDPQTGRLFLFQQGQLGNDNFVYVLSPDCNGNGIADPADIAQGLVADVNANGRPDNCELVSSVFCLADGSSSGLIACPCSNQGTAGRGCDNSAGTGGARLVASGYTFDDSLQFSSDGELPTVLSIFLQGSAASSAGVPFGDGVRCTSGSLKRLYVKNAAGGVAVAPAAGDAGVRAQSSSLGDVIQAGSKRWYQVYYRDPALNFCAAPQGSSWNVSSGLEVTW